jgi:hypothetical protein
MPELAKVDTTPGKEYPKTSLETGVVAIFNLFIFYHLFSVVCPKKGKSEGLLLRFLFLLLG